MWPDVGSFAIAQLTFLATVNGQRVMNTFGYQCGSIGAEKPADQVIQAFFADLVYIDLETDWLDCVSGDVTLDETWFQIIFPARIRKSVFERNLPGAADGVTNRQNTQACISRHGVTAARWANGGIHIPVPESGGTPDEYAVDGLITAAYKTTLGQLAASMLEPVETTVDGQAYNWTPGIINPDPETPNVFSLTEIVETNVQDEVRTMSRRTVRRGI